MAQARVAIGIAAYGTQPPDWWKHLATMIAGLPGYGIEFCGLLVANVMSTDKNRNAIVKAFLNGNADYLLWIDTDNTIPIGGLKRLLESGKALVSGLYHLKVPPYTPVAYMRMPDNSGYIPIHGFRMGEIIPIDMAGMGACLVHRSVYEAIQSKYVMLARHNGTIALVHVDDITGKINDKYTAPPKVHNSQYLETYRKMNPNKDTHFPFYYLEYGRTEDVPFFEMAQRCGFQPYVDTGVDCSHLGPKEVTSRDRYEYLSEQKNEMKREQDWQDLLKEEGLTIEKVEAKDN